METINTIDWFKARRRFLSNDHKIRVEYNGIIYNNSESAYQAQKHPETRLDFVNLKPAEAYKLGRSVSLRADWDDVRENIMYEVVRAKFEQNSKIRRMLIGTGDKKLLNTNGYHDNFWGNCCCSACKNIDGLNRLGIILMNLREEFRNQQS